MTQLLFFYVLIMLLWIMLLWQIKFVAGKENFIKEISHYLYSLNLMQDNIKAA